MIPQIFTVELLQLASGDRLALQVYRYVGSSPGKKAYVQANLHGCESAGNPAIYRLIEWLNRVEPTQLQGEIWLVPVCNPLGINHRTHFFPTGRFNPYDGSDWNRIFWEYITEPDDIKTFAKTQLDFDLVTIQRNYRAKQRRAFEREHEALQRPSSLSNTEQFRYQLQSLCLDADYVIDLHTSSNQGLDYLYLFDGRQESAPYFGFDYGILMTEYDGDAFDEAFMKPWLALEQAFVDLGHPRQFEVEAWTLELGSGMQINPGSVNKGWQGVQAYLEHKGLLQVSDRPLSPERPSAMQLVTRDQIKKYYAPMGGLIVQRVALGCRVQQDTTLYELLSFNKTQSLPTKQAITAEADGVVFDVSTNESMNQGEYVLSVFEI